MPEVLFIDICRKQQNSEERKQSRKSAERPGLQINRKLVPG
jgi:hypothetical protein